MQFLCHWNPAAEFGCRPVAVSAANGHHKTGRRQPAKASAEVWLVPTRAGSAARAFCEFVALAYPGPSRFISIEPLARTL
jgi:hypothetical protein